MIVHNLITSQLLGKEITTIDNKHVSCTSIRTVPEICYKINWHSYHPLNYGEYFMKVMKTIRPN